MSNPSQDDGTVDVATSPWTRGFLLALVTGVSLSAATAMAKAPSADASIDATADASARPKSRLFKARKAPRVRRIIRPGRPRPGTKRPGTKKPGGNESVTPPKACTIKTSDIINKKVDIGAQYSLMRKMSGDLYSRVEASSMLKAIEDGRLAGIFLPPRKAVSDRGKRMSPPKGYWQMIPKGKASTCLKQPAGEPPMILYRTNQTPGQIDAALTSAWKECGLLNLPDPCEYVVNLHKPQVECNTDQDCITKKIGDFCNTETNTCGVESDGLVVPADTCTYPRCDPAVSTSVWAACGHDSSGPIECRPVAGQQCGVCENVSKKSQTCHNSNETRHKSENAKCRAGYSPGKVAKYVPGCIKDMLKCETGDALACAKAAKCMVDPKPYKEYKQCLDKESARYHKEATRCRSL